MTEPVTVGDAADELFAGMKDGEWFVHYERGGRGHGYYVLVFRLDSPGRAQFVWCGSGANGAKDLGQLRKMVAGGQFSDQDHHF
jgi:hypothetical protein